MATFEQYICSRIAEDTKRMDILRAVEALDLPDWWIGGGFVRNKIWDVIHNLRDGPLTDIDVVYFDREKVNKVTEKCYADALTLALPGLDWDVKNQARMHEKNGNEPYTSSLDAISYWVETATAVAVTLRDDRVVLGAPLGTDDLLHCIVRQNPKFPHTDVFNERWRKKGWQDRWRRLRVVD